MHFSEVYEKLSKNPGRLCYLIDNGSTCNETLLNWEMQKKEHWQKGSHALDSSTVFIHWLFVLEKVILELQV